MEQKLRRVQTELEFHKGESSKHAYKYFCMKEKAVQERRLRKEERQRHCHEIARARQVQQQVTQPQYFPQFGSTMPYPMASVRKYRNRGLPIVVSTSVLGRPLPAQYNDKLRCSNVFIWQ